MPEGGTTLTLGFFRLEACVGLVMTDEAVVAICWRRKNHRLGESNQYEREWPTVSLSATDLETL